MSTALDPASPAEDVRQATLRVAAAFWSAIELNAWTLLAAAPLAAVCILGGSAHAACSVRVFPERPYLEQTLSGSAANYDIIVHNDGKTPMKIAEIDIGFFGQSGDLLLERRIDENGSAPSIETIGDRIVQPGQDRLIFNPFPTAPSDLTAISNRIRVLLEPPGRNDATGKPASVAETTVQFRDLPRQAKSLLLPLKGRVLVWDGHDILAHHRRWDYTQTLIRSLGFHANGMRYAYDLVLVDAAGNRFKGDPAKHESHYSWGAKIASPADGIVVDLENNQPDDGSFDADKFSQRPNLMFGNYLVLKQEDNVYSLLGHVQRGSVKPHIGDHVSAGDVIAAIGNSGTSMFPHLHFQLMTGPSMGTADGVPSSFRHLTRHRGSLSISDKDGVLETGDVVTAD